MSDHDSTVGRLCCIHLVWRLGTSFGKARLLGTMNGGRYKTVVMFSSAQDRQDIDDTYPGTYGVEVNGNLVFCHYDRNVVDSNMEKVWAWLS